MPRDNTACLTCRTRKVKCDRASPRCSTCSKLNRQCVSAGTSPEITWLHSDTVGEGAHGNFLQNENQLRQHGAKGRPLLSERERAQQVAQVVASMRNRSVDDVLAELDNVFDDSHGEVPVSVGPFDLFPIGKENCIEEANDQMVETDSHHEVTRHLNQDEVQMDSTFDASFEGLDLEEQMTQLSPEVEDVCERFDTALVHGHFEPVRGDAFLCASSVLLGEIPLLSQSIPIAHSSELNDLDFSTVQFLLDRYQHALVPCFSPARTHIKSPWEMLHIPKVYETLGEFMVRGDAGNSKVSLLFAVLGASAFHLDTLLPGSTAVSSPWSMMGRNYRTLAKDRLKASLKSLSLGQRLEEYQDVLMALLSMVTLCVVSGDMEDAYAYLRDVDHLIGFYDIDNTDTSSGVQMLHSTFLYLRTLQASVGIFGAQSAEISGKDHLRRNRQKSRSLLIIDATTSLWSNLLSEGRRPETTIVPQTSLKAPCHICDKNKSLFEKIYSLPDALFQLISRVTSLAQRIEHTQLHRMTATSSLDLLYVEASQLETDICDWKNDIADPGENDVVLPCSNCAVEDESDADQEATRRQARVALLYHFREAMHAALLIYFYRCVKHVDTHILQQFVDKTFHHLTRYGECKRDSNDPSSNICWPGFIAGCEASNPDARSKIAAWFSSGTESTGIRMFAVAGQAVKRVWEARDLARNRNLPWSKILMESRTLDRLVLS